MDVWTRAGVCVLMPGPLPGELPPALREVRWAGALEQQEVIGTGTGPWVLAKEQQLLAPPPRHTVTVGQLQTAKLTDVGRAMARGDRASRPAVIAMLPGGRAWRAGQVVACRQRQGRPSGW